MNTIGPLVLFQATIGLLKKSGKPKFVVVSSIMGSIELAPSMPPITVYGSSKAAVNYIVRRIHAENPELIAFPLHPGYVNFRVTFTCHSSYWLMNYVLWEVDIC